MKMYSKSELVGRVARCLAEVAANAGQRATAVAASMPVVVWALALSVGLVTGATAQTISLVAAPPQSLPYSQNFGTANFASLPTGWVGLSGLTGNATNSQTLAEQSAPPNIVNPTSAGTMSNGGTGGLYGLGGGSNGRIGILTAGGSTDGAAQVALALNTTGFSNITLQYDLAVGVANTRTIGVVAQYRLATSGGWTTLGTVFSTNRPTVLGNPYTQSGGVVDTVTTVRIPLPAACNNAALVQIRWAIWRGGEAGNSSGVTIDNVSASAPT